MCCLWSSLAEWAIFLASMVCSSEDILGPYLSRSERRTWVHWLCFQRLRPRVGTTGSTSRPFCKAQIRFGQISEAEQSASSLASSSALTTFSSFLGSAGLERSALESLLGRQRALVNLALNLAATEAGSYLALPNLHLLTPHLTLHCCTLADDDVVNLAGLTCRYLIHVSTRGSALLGLKESWRGAQVVLVH